MSASQRAKGAAAEREVAAIFRAAGWPAVGRTSNGLAQTGRGDIAGGPAGCHFEIKRQERVNVPAAFTQVVDDAAPTDVPVLVHRPSRHQWMATLPLEELLPLLHLRGAS